MKATRQLQSSNEYNIRKDLRELVQNVRANHFKDSCLRSAPDCDPAAQASTDFGLGLLFNFHHSVFLQSEAHGISEQFQKQMARDFCGWFNLAVAKDLWDRQTKAGNYDSERQRMRREWCDRV